MVMPTKTFSDYGKDFAFLMSEAPGRISREQAMIGPLAAIAPAGTVLGVVTATGEYRPLNPAGADGTQNAVAILGMGRSIKAAAQRVAIVARDCEVAARMLFWPAGITVIQKKAAEAALATKGILVRY